jgi:hypothetical protein
MSETLAKLNLYTAMDATRMYQTGEGLYPPKFDDSMRNRILKRLFDCLPFKPQVRFVWDYIILQGFRDGYIGYKWASIQALYVSTAYFKVWELRKGIVKPEDLSGYVKRERSEIERTRNIVPEQTKAVS